MSSVGDDVDAETALFYRPPVQTSTLDAGSMARVTGNDTKSRSSQEHIRLEEQRVAEEFRRLQRREEKLHRMHSSSSRQNSNASPLSEQERRWRQHSDETRRSHRDRVREERSEQFRASAPPRLDRHSHARRRPPSSASSSVALPPHPRSMERMLASIPLPMEAPGSYDSRHRVQEVAPQRRLPPPSKFIREELRGNKDRSTAYAAQANLIRDILERDRSVQEARHRAYASAPMSMPSSVDDSVYYSERARTDLFEQMAREGEEIVRLLEAKQKQNSSSKPAPTTVLRDLVGRFKQATMNAVERTGETLKDSAGALKSSSPFSSTPSGPSSEHRERHNSRLFANKLEALLVSRTHPLGALARSFTRHILNIASAPDANIRDRRRHAGATLKLVDELKAIVVVYRRSIQSPVMKMLEPVVVFGESESYSERQLASRSVDEVNGDGTSSLDMASSEHVLGELCRAVFDLSELLLDHVERTVLDELSYGVAYDGHGERFVATDESLHHARYLVESQMLPPIYTTLLSLFTQRNVELDARLKKVCQDFHSALPGHLGVRRRFWLIDGALGEEAPYVLATGILRLLPHYETAWAKLQCLVKAQQALRIEVDEYWRQQREIHEDLLAHTGEPIKKTSKSAELAALRREQSTALQIGGDDLLPILAYIVIKADIPDLMSHLDFTETLMPPRMRTEREGYCAVTFTTVAEYVSSLDESQLEQNIEEIRGDLSEEEFGALRAASPKSPRVAKATKSKTTVTDSDVWRTLDTSNATSAAVSGPRDTVDTHTSDSDREPVVTEKKRRNYRTAVESVKQKHSDVPPPRPSMPPPDRTIWKKTLPRANQAMRIVRPDDESDAEMSGSSGASSDGSPATFGKQRRLSRYNSSDEENEVEKKAEGVESRVEAAVPVKSGRAQPPPRPVLLKEVTSTGAATNESSVESGDAESSENEWQTGVEYVMRVLADATDRPPLPSEPVAPAVPVDAAEREALVTRRRKIVSEFYASEVSYVTALETVCSEIMDVCKLQNILTQAQLDEVFGNLRDIVRLNRTKLLEPLEKVAGLTLSATVDVAESDHSVAVILKDAVPSVAFSYALYCLRFETANNSLLKLLKKTKSFRKLCAKVREMPRANGLDLPSMLIMPIQRLPRYLLLLRELVGALPSDNHESVMLRDEVLPVLSDVLQSIDEGMVEACKSTVATAIEKTEDALDSLFEKKEARSPAKPCVYETLRMRTDTAFDAKFLDAYAKVLH